MDKRDALIIAQTYARVINEKYEGAKVFLFGSYAKGNFNEDSDIDIAIVFKDFNNIMDMQLDLMRLRRKIDSRIEPHPFREQDFNETNPIVTEILKYGSEVKIKFA